MTDAALLSPPRYIRALTLWEPWASLIAAGLKRHETRAFPTKHRGLLAIHAGLTVDAEGAPALLCDRAFGPGWAANRPTGCVLALAELTACKRTGEVLADPASTVEDLMAGAYSPGRWAWRLDRVRPFREPIPARGARGFWPWTPPEDLDARLAAPVSHEQAVRLLKGAA